MCQRIRICTVAGQHQRIAIQPHIPFGRHLRGASLADPNFPPMLVGAGTAGIIPVKQYQIICNPLPVQPFYRKGPPIRQRNRSQIRQILLYRCLPLFIYYKCAAGRIIHAKKAAIPFTVSDDPAVCIKIAGIHSGPGAISGYRFHQSATTVDSTGAGKRPQLVSAVRSQGQGIYTHRQPGHIILPECIGQAISQIFGNFDDLDTIHIDDKTVGFLQYNDFMLRRFLQSNHQLRFLFSFLNQRNICNGCVIDLTLHFICSRIDVKNNPVLRTVIFKFCRRIHVQHDAYPCGTTAYPHTCNLRLYSCLQAQQKNRY